MENVIDHETVYQFCPTTWNILIRNLSHSNLFSSVLLPILRLSSLLNEASRAQRRQLPSDSNGHTNGQQNREPSIPFASLSALSSTIHEFRAGVISVVPRLIFNLQAYLIAGSKSVQISLQDFPTSLPHEGISSHLSFSSAVTTPASQSPPELVLINAIRISILEAVRSVNLSSSLSFSLSLFLSSSFVSWRVPTVRHIQSSILTSKFCSDDSSESIFISLNELQEKYNWWTPAQVY